MARKISNLILITDGYWMHIRHIRAVHRHYPDVRGEGRTPSEAASQLKNQLDRALDFAQGREREAIERAIADVRALLASRSRHAKGSIVAAP